MERAKESFHLDEVIANNDLLVADKIPVAEKINNPEQLSKIDLLPMFYFSKLYFAKHDFNAAAYTQYPDIFFESMSADKKLKNIVCFGHKQENFPLINQLVINPDYEIIDDKTITTIEGCGSIGMGKIQMAVQRPKNIILSGYFWNPMSSNPKKEQIQLYDWPSAMVQHEINHLKGKTALSHPEKIIDITNPGTTFLENLKINLISWHKFLKKLSKDHDCQYLINKNGNLQIVNYSKS